MKHWSDMSAAERVLMYQEKSLLRKRELEMVGFFDGGTSSRKPAWLRGSRANNNYKRI